MNSSVASVCFSSSRRTPLEFKPLRDTYQELWRWHFRTNQNNSAREHLDDSYMSVSCTRPVRFTYDLFKYSRVAWVVRLIITKKKWRSAHYRYPSSIKQYVKSPMRRLRTLGNWGMQNSFFPLRLFAQPCPIGRQAKSLATADWITSFEKKKEFFLKRGKSFAHHNYTYPLFNLKKMQIFKSTGETLQHSSNV